jgi:hypothetical protein
VECKNQRRKGDLESLKRNAGIGPSQESLHLRISNADIILEDIPGIA